MDMSQELLRDLEHLSLSKKSFLDPDESETDYVVDLTLQSTGNLLAAASSNFSIYLLTTDQLQTTSTIKGHRDTITKLQFCKSDPNMIYSSSKDKTLRCWDMRTNKQVQSYEIPSTINVELLSMDVSHSGRLLCAGTERMKNDSYLLFWDSRQRSVLGCYSECHQDDITQISFQPESDQYLASGASDGLVCTFDLTQTSEDDSLQITSNAGSDVARIGWCGDDSSAVYAVTSDSTFNAWNALEGDPLCSVQSLMDLQTKKKDSPLEYILDCVPALTSTDMSPHSAILLAGTYSGELSMISVGEATEPSTVCTLSQGHTAPIRCCSRWDPQTKSLLTGGEDSLVCLWSVERAMNKSADGHKKGKVKGKIKSKASISSGTKKPYARPKR